MTRNSNSVDERVEEKPGVLDGVSLISSLLRDISLIKFPTSIQVLKDNQMAGHGGKREGAGRQKGKPNKITIERQEQVIREKREPLDRMLQAMQIFESLVEYYQPGTTEQPNPNHDEAKYLANVQRMADTAAKAAPYVHHRLATTVHSEPNDGAIPIEAINNAVANMSDEDLNALGRLLEPLAAAVRVTPGVSNSSRAGNPSKKH